MEGRDTVVARLSVIQMLSLAAMDGGYDVPTPFKIPSHRVCLRDTHDAIGGGGVQLEAAWAVGSVGGVFCLL